MIIESPRYSSVIHGGFECSTHVLRSGRRLDLLAATRHDEFAVTDYARLAAHGILTVREGLRWHRIETTAFRHDFSSVLPLVQAAREAGMQVIWDLCHFGWPDGLDPFRPAFVERFAALARAFATLLRDEGEAAPFIAPINEISFVSWVGAEVGGINPFVEDRGFELKCQLVRASIAAIEAVRQVAPAARFFQNEPMFNVVPALDRPEDAEPAEAYRQLQFQVWDMLRGDLWPQLGGSPEYLDVVGVNYYPWNQWLYAGPKFGGAGIDRMHPGWRGLDRMLAENHERYGRPLYVAETGCEDERRASWFAFVCEEVRRARGAGVPVDAICLYPIVNFPGWDNERHCHNGLWDYADDHGERAIYPPLASELQRQRSLFGEPDIDDGIGMLNTANAR